MKLVLKFVFDTLRNISLLIVICLVCLFIYLVLNKESASNLLVSLNERHSKELPQKEIDYNEGFGLLAINESPLDFSESKKLKIEVKGGFAYLRPSQIMYIKSGSRTIIKTINDVEIEAKMNLTELENTLQNSNIEDFFRIKPALINCNYVLQLAKESSKYKENYSYQHIVIMEDGEKIKISKAKAEQLFKILDEMSF